MKLKKNEVAILLHLVQDTVDAKAHAKDERVSEDELAYLNTLDELEKKLEIELYENLEE